VTFFKHSHKVIKKRKAGTIMNAKKLLVGLVVVVAAIYFIPRSGKSTNIEQRGRDLSITVGKHHMTAVIVGDQSKNSFLVMRKGACQGDWFFTAWFSVIPIDTATKLNQRYGNFLKSIKCGSRKAYDVQRSMTSMMLYAADHDNERKLRSIDKLASAKKNPVIRMTFAEIHITNHTVRGEETPIVFNSNVRPFLVRDIQIIEKDRNF
jgi:hypothetical protein